MLVQAYSSTWTTLAEALVRVHKKGINVRAILDKNQKAHKYSTANLLAGASIPVLIDAIHAIAHNKVMVIDSEIVITGSFNFTKAVGASKTPRLALS